MYNNYKEQAGRRSDASFHDNPHEPTAVPADVLKSTTTPHWNLPRPNPLPYGGYLGEQHANNQMIQDGHYTSCANRPNNTNQRIIRPTARINCQSNCNGLPYCNHTPRGPHQWNLPSENAGSVKSIPQFPTTDSRTRSRTATNVDTGIDFSRYPREAVPAQHGTVPTYKEAVAVQERPANQLPVSDALSKKDAGYDCQVNLMAHQTSCKYPVPGQLPLNLGQPQPPSHWIASSNQPQPDFWTIQNESRRVMAMEGNPVSGPSKYWMPKKDVVTNRQEPTSRMQDIYNYNQMTYQHQKRLEASEKMQQFQENFGKEHIVEPMDWSHEAIRASNIVPPYSLSRYTDRNLNNAHNSQTIGPQTSLLPLDSYGHNKLQTGYDSPQLHSRLTGYQHSKLTKSSYFEPHLQSSHPKSYVPLNLDGQVMHLNPPHPEPVTTQAGTRVYVGNMPTYMNPTLNACNEMYDSGSYGQSMQVVDKPCPPTSKNTAPYEREMPHFYENMLHQNNSNLANNMFYDSKLAKLNGYNSFYGNVAETLPSRNPTPYGLFPQSQNNASISAVKPTHSLTLSENTAAFPSQPAKKRKSLADENVSSSSNWATITKSNEKTPILDVRHFLSTWEEDEEPDLTNPELPVVVLDPPSGNKSDGVFVLDCTNVERNEGTESHELLPNTKSQESGVIQLYKAAPENAQGFPSVIKPIVDCQAPLELTHLKHKFRYKSMQEVTQPLMKVADVEKVVTESPPSKTCNDNIGSEDVHLHTENMPPVSPIVSLSEPPAVPQLKANPLQSVLEDQTSQIISEPLASPSENSVPKEQVTPELPQESADIPEPQSILNDQPNGIVEESVPEPVVANKPTSTSLSSEESNTVLEEVSKLCPDATDLALELTLKNDQQTPVSSQTQTKEVQLKSDESDATGTGTKIPDKLPETTSDSVIKYVASDVQNEENNSIQYCDQEISAVDLSCRSLITTNDEKNQYESMEEIPMPTLEPISDIHMSDYDQSSDDEDFSSDMDSLAGSEEDNANSEIVSPKGGPGGTVTSQLSDVKSMNSFPIGPPKSDQSAEYLELNASYEGSCFQSDSSVDEKHASSRKDSNLFSNTKSTEEEKNEKSETLIDIIAQAEEENKIPFSSRKSTDVDSKLRFFRIPNRNKSRKLYQDQKNDNSELKPKITSHIEIIKSNSPLVEAQEVSISNNELSKDLIEGKEFNIQTSEDKMDKEDPVETPSATLFTPADESTEESETIGDYSSETTEIKSNENIELHDSIESDEDFINCPPLVRIDSEEMSIDVCSEGSPDNDFEPTDIVEESLENSDIILDGAGEEMRTDEEQRTKLEQAVKSNEEEILANNSLHGGNESKAHDPNEVYKENLDMEAEEASDVAVEYCCSEETIEDTAASIPPHALKTNVPTEIAASDLNEDENEEVTDESSTIDLIKSYDHFNTSCFVDREMEVAFVPQVLKEGIEEHEADKEESEVRLVTAIICEEEVKKMPKNTPAVEEAIEELDGKAMMEELDLEPAYEEEMETSSEDVLYKCKEVDSSMLDTSKELLEPSVIDNEKSIIEELNVMNVNSNVVLDSESPNLVEESNQDMFEDSQEVIQLSSDQETVGEEMNEKDLLHEGSKEDILETPSEIDKVKLDANSEDILLCDHSNIDKQLETMHETTEVSEEMVLDSDALISNESEVVTCETVNTIDDHRTVETFNTEARYAQSDEFNSDTVRSDTEDSDSSSDEDSNIDVETFDLDPKSRYYESLCISQHSDSEESDLEEEPKESKALDNTITASADSEMPALEVIAELSPNNSDLLEMPQLELMSAECDADEDMVSNILPPVEQNDSELSADEREPQDHGDNLSWPDEVTFDRPESTIRIDSVHNWPYLEEEVFSETPRNLSPLIETTCSGHLLSPYTNSDSEPEMPLTTYVPSRNDSIDSSSAENEMPNLKCRLSWDKIFNLSKTNGSQKSLNETEFARRWSCVKSNNGANENSLGRGFEQSYLHDKADQALESSIGLELGPAKIEVRLTQKPLVPEQWQVIDGPKADSMSSVSFGEENNNISEFDSRSMESIIGKSPIVLVKRIILKRRADDSVSFNDSIAIQQNHPRPSATSGDSDDSMSNPKTLPKVIIKRMAHGTTKYQSFLRTSESEEKMWQPVVRLERRKSIDDLARKLISNRKEASSNFEVLHTEESVQNSREENLISTSVTSVDEENVSPDQFSHFSTVKNHSKDTILFQDKDHFEKSVTGINGEVKNGRIETNVVNTSGDENDESRLNANEDCIATNQRLNTVQEAEKAEPSDTRLLSFSRKKRVADWKSEAKNPKIRRKYARHDSATSKDQRTRFKQNKMKRVPVKKPLLQSCQACDATFADVTEKTTHIKTHSYHCQRCNMAFKSQLDFEVHLSATHPHTKELHHCLLCKLCFASAGEHQRHLTEREHQRLDLTQRWTIQRLFMMFSGTRCSRLVPFTEEETAEMTTLTDAEPGAINYYHQATPLQLAEQDLRENILSTDVGMHVMRNCKPDTRPYSLETD